MMKFDKNLIKEPNEKIIYKTVGNLKLPMNIYRSVYKKPPQPII